MIKYQKTGHEWGPGTVVELPSDPDDIDTQPTWWRAIKGLAMVVGLLGGGLLLFFAWVVISGQWIGDD